ncbi:MAG: hypothetical protein GYB49_00485 [Alphaproteobacteria bacterium]|nr:hypothetical protein [Alphaproteobacteria bacterium]
MPAQRVAASAAENQQALYGFSRKEILLFAVLFIIFLAPALLNGFPLVMGDSIAYSGEGAHWMRGKTAAVLMALPFKLLGYWALPVFNSLLNAFAWLLVFRLLHAEPKLPAYLALIICSLQPLYTSAVIVDSWFFPALVLLCYAARSRWVLMGILAGVLLSAHGSGVILAIVFSGLSLLVCRKAKPAYAALLAIVVAVGFNSVLDATVSPDRPRLSKTFPASRAFSVQPELLEREAERSGDASLLKAAELTRQLKTTPGEEQRRDFFWDLWSSDKVHLDLVKFETEHAMPIVLDALFYDPVPLGFTILRDFGSFYSPQTEFDFRQNMVEEFGLHYEASMQAAGVFEDDIVSHIATAMRYVCYVCFLAALIFGWNRTSVAGRRLVLAIGLMIVCNDALFAILSGPPDRYHHRILPLLVVAILILMQGHLTRHVSGDHAIQIKT